MVTSGWDNGSGGGRGMERQRGSSMEGARSKLGKGTKNTRNGGSWGKRGEGGCTADRGKAEAKGAHSVGPTFLDDPHCAGLLMALARRWCHPALVSLVGKAMDSSAGLVKPGSTLQSSTLQSSLSSEGFPTISCLLRVSTSPSSYRSLTCIRLQALDASSGGSHGP